MRALCGLGKNGWTQIDNPSIPATNFPGFGWIGKGEVEVGGEALVGFANATHGNLRDREDR
jgi:hypothetical protein